MTVKLPPPWAEVPGPCSTPAEVESDPRALAGEDEQPMSLMSGRALPGLNWYRERRRHQVSNSPLGACLGCSRGCSDLATFGSNDLFGISSEQEAR